MPATLQRRSDGTLHYVTGSMGSGKTSLVRQATLSAPRALYWDGKGIDWGARERCAVIGPHELRAALFAPRGRFSYRVPVSRESFDVFCRLAWVWGRFLPSVIVVDEIADVTNTGKAPQAWGEIARKVRAFGTDVWVTTQRPQEADKTAQGNAMLFHCGLMADADDQVYVARRLLGGVPVADVASLAPLEFLERDVRTRTVTRRRLALSRRRRG
jgi:hypothetical protein